MGVFCFSFHVHFPHFVELRSKTLVENEIFEFVSSNVSHVLWLVVWESVKDLLADFPFPSRSSNLMLHRLSHLE